MPLKTIANLNNYVIKNIISQESGKTNDNRLTDVRLAKDQAQLVIARNHNMYASMRDTARIADKNSCDKCLSKSRSYIDSLKYDLFRRIELEINKGNLLVFFKDK